MSNPISINDAITAAFALLPAKMESAAARLMLLTIQRQEDPELSRHQLVRRTPQTHPDNVLNEGWAKGPARGAWQFEQNGGIKSVLTHPATWKLAKEVCRERSVLFSAGACWRALETDDVFAAAFARLLLWSDTGPLPELGEVRHAFNLYLRTWRPGAYTHGTPAKQAELWTKWQLNYAKAMDIIT